MGAVVTSLFYTFAEVGELLGGKSAKTIGRWIETEAGFPQPVPLGSSRLLLREEVDAYVEKLKESRNRNRRTQ